MKNVAKMCHSGRQLTVDDTFHSHRASNSHKLGLVMQMIYFIINVVLSNQNGKILRTTVVWSNEACAAFTKGRLDVPEKLIL